MYLPGECIIIETDEYEDGTTRAHLFIIIYQALVDDEKTIIVPISNPLGKRNIYTTVEINIGDYDFVKELSFIYYYEGKIRTKRALDKLLLTPNAHRRKPNINKQLLESIKRGIMKSEDSPQDLKILYNEKIMSNF